MSTIKQLEGKQFVIKLDGRTRTIGEISVANIDQERTELEIAVRLTDEEVAGILGAAADKAERANPDNLGLTDAEVAKAIGL